MLCTMARCPESFMFSRHRTGEKYLFQLYQKFFENCSVCESLKTGVILQLFKGNGSKANNKDNYRGITLFPTLCKIMR